MTGETMTNVVVEQRAQRNAANFINFNASVTSTYI